MSWLPGLPSLEPGMQGQHPLKWIKSFSASSREPSLAHLVRKRAHIPHSQIPSSSFLPAALRRVARTQGQGHGETWARIKLCTALDKSSHFLQATFCHL